MSRIYVIASLASIALVGMVLCGGLAGAAEPTPAPAPPDVKPDEAPMKACPMCPMMAGKGMEMGNGMDMPPVMKQRCQMIMNAKMSKDDAVCLLACTPELTLTPEQVQKLEHIVKQSRQEAAAILTPEQQKTLAEVPEKPTSLCEMHTNMHEKMVKKMEAADPKLTEEGEKKEPEAADPPKE